MLESHITYSDLELIEPLLSDLLFEREISLQDIVDEARKRLIANVENRLPNRGADFKKICNRLELALSTKSNEDLVGRRRLVIQLASAETNVFKLEKSSDGITWLTLLETISINDAEVHTYLLEDTNSYYKLTQTTGSATLNKGYLVETCFELPHTYLALSMAYKRLQDTPDDLYKQKSDGYYQDFLDTLNNLNYSFDSDNDGAITSSDSALKNNIVRILR